MLPMEKKTEFHWKQKLIEKIPDKYMKIIKRKRDAENDKQSCDGLRFIPIQGIRQRTDAGNFGVIGFSPSISIVEKLLDCVEDVSVEVFDDKVDCILDAL